MPKPAMLCSPLYDYLCRKLNYCTGIGGGGLVSASAPISTCIRLRSRPIGSARWRRRVCAVVVDFRMGLFMIIVVPVSADTADAYENTTTPHI